MNDCIVQITSQGKEKLLYLNNKGGLAHAGTEVAIVASNILERETSKDVENIADSLFFSSLDFTPVCQGSDDITFQYHIDITARENVIIGYHKADKENKRYKVSTFVRMVNAAKLRQPTSSYTQTERLEIADTILRQMGGSGRLVAMVGMHTPMTITPDLGVIFSFRGSRKANKCRVTYSPIEDLYTFELLKYTQVRYAHCPVVFRTERVFFDMLQGMFEQETGLYLSF